jgi:L-lactate dehydrogenase complex protein LldG
MGEAQATEMSASGRETVLARIKAALGNRLPTKAEAASIEERTTSPPVGPRPGLAGDLIEQFVAKARGNLFTVERIASLQLLVPAVEGLLAGTSGVPDISVAPALSHLGWPAGWRINFGAGRRIEPMTVTPVLAGIAETGSVVLLSSPSSPTSLNFLPDTHVVVLRASDIVGFAEDVWARLCREDWPRTVNIISGPSRTADVGGIVVRPAHGPKAVHLILVDG